MKTLLLLLPLLPLFAQPSLRTVPVPQPTNIDGLVRDRAALTALGKALFWDMQVGSDGRTACATCHFHAGADHRSQHQFTNPHFSYQSNAILTASDFPFRLLNNPNNNASGVLRENSGVYGSAGVFRRQWTAAEQSTTEDAGYDLADSQTPVWEGLNVRQITTRNSPSVINAVFNARNFWDGRARNTFNGLNPFAAADPRGSLVAWREGQFVAIAINAANASLASQAVGPPTNSIEMSYNGLTWPELGRRLLRAAPLAGQRVAADDSVLGDYANPAGKGLRAGLTYRSLIEAAFAPELWQADAPYKGFAQAEWNFSLFFGLALERYQATLVSDDTPFDRFAAGDNSAMTPQQIAGLNLFRGRAGCAVCHSGPEFTAAAVNATNNFGPGRGGPPIGGGPGPGGVLGPEAGFFRIAVSLIEHDPGLGGVDDLGQRLSLNPAARGAFKTPGLRNVEFTGPYFHNGSQATLEQVMEFYNRGGDYPAGGVGPGIRPLNLNAAERAALVAFMLALSDDRVRYQRAPFDHPDLCVPNGHKPLVQTQDARYTLSADENWALVPATGRDGATAPLQTFIEMLNEVGRDGSRANSLAEACPAP